jgi:DNA mismatch endonuclease, patch repair protein
MDKVSVKKRSEIMSAIRSKNTKPELALRQLLRSSGHRYRIHYGEENIDVAFPSQKIAIFVDGCFWHGCPIHSHIPKTNVEYWKTKLERNIKRENLRNKRLESDGWTVIRLWEHDIQDKEKLLKILTNLSI